MNKHTYIAPRVAFRRFLVFFEALRAFSSCCYLCCSNSGGAYHLIMFRGIACLTLLV